VNFHGAKAYLKPSRGLFLGHTFHDEVENFELATGELGLILCGSGFRLRAAAGVQRLGFIYTRRNKDSDVESHTLPTTSVRGSGEDPTTAASSVECRKSFIRAGSGFLTALVSDIVEPRCYSESPSDEVRWRNMASK
jgi:hypothetical protein